MAIDVRSPHSLALLHDAIEKHAPAIGAVPVDTPMTQGDSAPRKADA